MTKGTIPIPSGIYNRRAAPIYEPHRRALVKGLIERGLDPERIWRVDLRDDGSAVIYEYLINKEGHKYVWKNGQVATRKPYEIGAPDGDN